MLGSIMHIYNFVMFLMFLSGQFVYVKNSFVSSCNLDDEFCDGFDEKPAFIGDTRNLSQKTKVKAIIHGNTSDVHSKEEEEINNRMKRSSASRTIPKEETQSSQVTTILDKLLFESGYDRQIRPEINGPPVHVIALVIHEF